MLKILQVLKKVLTREEKEEVGGGGELQEASDLWGETMLLIKVSEWGGGCTWLHPLHPLFLPTPPTP